MKSMRRDEAAMVEECQFAKEVVTADGPALLIGGCVVSVKGPRWTYPGEQPLNWAEVIATALRRPDLGKSNSAAEMDNHFREELAKAANARQ